MGLTSCQRVTVASKTARPQRNCTTRPSSVMVGHASGDEIFRLGVVTDDRVGRLLWMQLESFRDGDANAL